MTTAQSSTSNKLAQLLRGSRTVLPTNFTAPGQWRPTPKSFLALCVGLWIFGVGEALLLAADLGAAPWTVFAQGLSVRTGISIGWTTFITSGAVMLLWIPLKQRPGLGTIMNMILIALSLGVTYSILSTPSSTFLRYLMVFAGIALIGIGSGFYLTSGHGPGPRDGLMMGLHRRTDWPVGRLRLFIEVTALIIGWLLGGTVGIGTAIFALLIGQSIAMGLHIVHGLFPSPDRRALEVSNEPEVIE